MKKFSILGHTDQILTANGKTLDKVIEQNNGSSSSDRVMLLNDDENPVFSFGNSLDNLQFTQVYEPIQLVFNAAIDELEFSTFFDIINPVEDKGFVGNDYISLFRRPLTLKSIRHTNNSVDVIADIIVTHDMLQTPYVSEKVGDVSIDLDTPSVTYSNTFGEMTINVTFNIFTVDATNKVTKPKSVTVSEDGTKLYVLASSLYEPYEFVIAAAGINPGGMA